MLLSVVLSAAFVFSAGAQTIGEEAARKVAYSNASPLASAPFEQGETLTYEAKINKILKGIPAADLTFTVVPSLTPNEFTVKAIATSKGTLLKLFRYSFLQQYQSSIDPIQFRTLKTTKHDVQKDRVRDSEAIFNYGEKRVTFLESDPNEPMKAPRRIASGINDRTHDLISALYALRLAPLDVGKTFNFTLSDSGLVYDVPVKITAREQQDSIFGDVLCFRAEPQVFGPGRMIEQEGSMIIWITDDERRIPVRSQVNAPVGRIEIKLRSAQNLK